MSEEKKCCEVVCGKKMGCNAMGGGAYGLGFVGALVYFLQNADSFMVGLFGVFKAIFWPAFMVYNLFKFLGL